MDQMKLEFKGVCDHVSHLMGRSVPTMVRAKWESAGATGLHLLHLQGGLTLNAGKPLTARLDKICTEVEEDDSTGQDDMHLVGWFVGWMVGWMICTWMVGRRMRLFSARRTSPGFTSREATNRLQYRDKSCT